VSRKSLWAIACLMMPLAAGCGSSKAATQATTAPLPATTKSAQSSTAATGATTAGTVGASPAATKAATPASGDPIVLGSIQGFIDSARQQNIAGMKAAEKAVNAAGGVNGRPIRIDVCEDSDDANKSAKCARDFAANNSLVSLVDNSTNGGDSINPVLEANKLPAVGSSLYNGSDFSSPMVFPADGGSVSGIATAGPLCFNTLGAKKLSLAYVDLAAGAQVVGLMDTFVLPPFGTKVSLAVPVSPTAADLSSQAAKLVTDNAECLATALPQEATNQLIKALHQQGYKGHIITSSLTHSEHSLVAQLGKDAEGVVVMISYDPASAMYKQFQTDLKASAGSAFDEVLSDQSAKGWLSVQIAVAALKAAGASDRASLLKTLQSFKFDTGGMLQGPLDYAARIANPKILGGSSPNLIMPYALGAEMKSGVLTPINHTWNDAFGGKK
jgi:ABC-type branched-subunit amino acid transport system substrate-binding protein